jgi:hypothetical protein
MSRKSILSLLGVDKNRTFLVMAMRGRRVFGLIGMTRVHLRIPVLRYHAPCG